MVTIRPVTRAARTVSDEPIVNDYTPIVLELRDELANGKRLEAVLEADEFPADTTPQSIRLEINRTARTHGVPLNFKSVKADWPIVFSVSKPREAGDDESTDATVDTIAETPKATGKTA